jgi:MFS transporter, OFA family, oxalate/formate antiporter
MLLIGSLYSWGIFTEPLTVAFGWDVTTATWAYAIANFSLAAIGAVVGGFWQDRAGPRPVALTGVCLWGVGNLLAGLGTARFGAPWLYLTYGFIGGVGAGMAYITPLAVASKWFPERRGFAGGLIVAGFGLGAFLYNQIVPRLPSFHLFALEVGRTIAARDAAHAALAVHPSAAGIAAVMPVFTYSGICFLAIGIPAALLLRNPTRRPTSAPRSDLGLPPSAVVRMPQFYLLWLQLFANVIAGIAIISNAVVILADLTGLASVILAPLFGLVSIFNAVGRFFWGAISDRIGCERTFAAMFVVQAVTLYGLRGAHDPVVAFSGFAIVLLCCGGGFGTMPSYSAQCFGTRYMGLNYGLLLTAWGVAGVIGPLLVARTKDVFGSSIALMPAIGGVLIVSLALPLLTWGLARRSTSTASDW